MWWAGFALVTGYAYRCTVNEVKNETGIQQQNIAARNTFIDDETNK